MRKFSCIFIIFVILVLFLSGISVWADTLTFGWDANSEPDLAGYRLYWRVGANSSYSSTPIVSIPAGTTTCQATIPHDLVTNYFVVTAYDTEGLESGYSNEVSYTPNFPPDAPQNFKILSP